jgi:hypothetical protein
VSAVLVDILEILSQFFNLAFICHFDKHVHGSLLEFADTFIISKPVYSIDIELVIVTLGKLLGVFYPRMSKDRLG